MDRPHSGRRSWIAPAAALLALAGPGCARDRSEITPTTSGTDLRAMPRGRMTPQPFPGSSLARGPSRPAQGGPTVDPEAITASSEVAPR